MAFFTWDSEPSYRGVKNPGVAEVIKLRTCLVVKNQMRVTLHEYDFFKRNVFKKKKKWN